jgi:hypothetical protein
MALAWRHRHHDVAVSRFAHRRTSWLADTVTFCPAVEMEDVVLVRNHVVRVLVCTRTATRNRKLLTESCLLAGCMTVAIVYGMHVLIQRANAVSPPLLATDRFVLMLLIYLCGLGWWFMTFVRHFQQTDKHS